jgi:hypothetical protein
MSNVNNYLSTAFDIVTSQREKIIKYQNSERTKLFFWLGKLIAEQESLDQDQHTAHTRIISTLSEYLCSKFGPNYDSNMLESSYTLYKKAKNLTGQLSFKLPLEHYQYLINLSDDEIIYYEGQALKNNLNLKELTSLVTSAKQD